MGNAESVSTAGDERRIAIADLAPDKRNARKHNRFNLEAIAASLQRFGQRTKLVVRRDGMVVLKGNGTLAAAKMLGWEHLDCLLVDDDAKTGAAYAIADNRSAELAEWDEPVLAHALADIGPELKAIVWPEDIGDGDCGDSVGDDADNASEPDPEVEPTTAAGELIELGEHRLLCGDSTRAADVALVLDGAEPRLWLFDPPFDLAYEQWVPLPSVDVVAVWHRSKSALLWMGKAFADDAWGVHDLVFTGGVRGQHNHTLPCCMHDHVSIWRRHWWNDKMEAIDRDVIRSCGCNSTSDGRHVSWQEHVGGVMTGVAVGMSWGKPVMESAIAMSYVPRGSVVYDSCAGSGSTLLAAEQHGRVWRGIEMQPRWCDLIVARWEKLTGKTAVRHPAPRPSAAPGPPRP